MNRKPSPALTMHQCGLLIIDAQERMIAQVERPCEITAQIAVIARAANLLQMPVIVSLQQPQILGQLCQPIQHSLEGAATQCYSKECFNCMGSEPLAKQLLDHIDYTWLIVGAEAHISVLQTAKAIQRQGGRAIVLNDAISSRSIFDFSTAIAEMRDEQIRVSSVETILFELVDNTMHPLFTPVQQLTK